MLGILLSLLAAATFALNATAARRAVLSGTVLQGLMITVPLGVPLFLVLSLIVGDFPRLFEFSPEALFWFAAAGVVHFVLGRYCNYAAGAAIGTNLASPIMQGEVLVTLALAIVLLNEHFTPLRIIGIALVLLGPLLVMRREEAKPKAVGAAPTASSPAAPPQPRFQPRYLEGYAMATLGAIAYGISPVLIGLGLRASGGTGYIAGGLVSYIAGAAVVGLILLLTRQPASTYHIHRHAMSWFLLAGFVVFLSHAFRYGALAFVPVSVMTTLQRLSSIFRIYLSWIINRDHEVFDSGVIVATVVSMLGAIALSVSTDLFLSLADWPDWLIRFARMRWP